MHIVVIGAGNVGMTLGTKWAKAGHRVVYGARDPNSAKVQAALAASAGRASAAPFETALADAEVVVLALPGTALAEFAQAYGSALAGKLVIDATNHFGQPVINGLAALSATAPNAILARAFNSLGWENFAEPVIGGVQADLLFCAPAGQASEQIAQLISAVGLNPIRVGDLSQVALVDNLGVLWGALAYGQGYGRRVAFKVLAE